MDITPWLVVDEETSSYSFNLDRLHTFERGSLEGVSELDAALSLLDAIGELVENWEDGTSDEGPLVSEQALRVLQRVCARMGIDVDLTSDLATSGARRREYAIWGMLEPAHAQLLEYERLELAATLQESGWPTIDREAAELRSLWKSAASPAQFSAVGNQALRVVEALSGHLGSADIPRNRTINRLMAALDAASPSGEANEHLKRLVSDAVNVANAAKHDTEPSRLKAGAAANAALALVGIMRAAH